MQTIITMLMGNTAIALLFACAGFTAKWMRRPALAHVIWLIVLLKLLTPPMFRIPIVLPEQNGDAASFPAADVMQVHEGLEKLAASPLLSAPGESVSEARLTRSIDLSLVVILLWGCGSTVVAGFVVARLLRFRRMMKLAMPAGEEIVARVGILAQRIGLKRPPVVRVLPGAVSPMVYWMGGRRAHLIVPASLTEKFSPRQRDAILVHELAHLRRRDHWVRAFEIIATIAMWWHPLLWIARRGLREAEEQCCDAWVVSSLPESRRAYADALVDGVNVFCCPPLPPGASGLGQFRHLKGRLVMIMGQTSNKSLSRTGRLIVAAMLLALPIAPVAMGQNDKSATAQPAAANDKDEQIRQLQERIKQLEERLAKAEEMLNAQAAKPASGGGAVAVAGTPVAAANPNAVTQAQRDALRRKARQRSALDAKKYKPEQLAECEQLYQVANKNWRAPEAITSLKTMIEKYPDVNRTGCAVLYLGQMSEGDTREQYLKQAVEKHSDCFYFNGVQVGGFARYLLADYYKEIGKLDEATKLLDELATKYPDAITHGGDLLAKVVQQE